MSQPEDKLARMIVSQLDHGADHLDRMTRERLLEARKNALSHYRERRQPAWGWSWAVATGNRRGQSHPQSTRYLIAGMALIVALLGFFVWQKDSAPNNELAEIDAGLLTADLPINAYLDKGFDSWLKRSQR